jgi:aquaporin Z
MGVSLTKRAAAEFLGTFVLVLMGCGSAVLAGHQIGYVGISLAFGLSVVGMAYAIGHVSGCHLNPAISVGFWAARRMPAEELPAYILAQLAGAVVAALTLWLIASGKSDFSLATNGLGANGVGSSPNDYSIGSCLLSEFVFTAIFVFVVLGSTSKNNTTPIAGLGIGLTLTLIHLVGIPLTGVSVNPARSFGPALIIGGKAMADLWVFIVGPVAGGLLGAAIYSVIDVR